MAIRGIGRAGGTGAPTATAQPDRPDPDRPDPDEVLLAILGELTHALTVVEAAGLDDLLPPLRTVVAQTQQELDQRSHRRLQS